MQLDSGSQIECCFDVTALIHERELAGIGCNDQNVISASEVVREVVLQPASQHLGHEPLQVDLLSLIGPAGGDGQIVRAGQECPENQRVLSGIIVRRRASHMDVLPLFAPYVDLGQDLPLLALFGRGVQRHDDPSDGGDIIFGVNDRLGQTAVAIDDPLIAGCTPIFEE